MARYIKRRVKDQVIRALRKWPAVSISGARRIGKSTLADEIAKEHDAVQFDMGSAADREFMRNPEKTFPQLKDKLIIVDEVQHVPHLFLGMRKQIDIREKAGHEFGQFLFLGSFGGESFGQLHETLTGRLKRIKMHGLDLLEVNDDEMYSLWDRGSFPNFFLADDRDDSYDRYHQYFNNSFLSVNTEVRDKLYRIFSAIADSQGGPAALHKWGSYVHTDSRTLKSYLSKLDDAFLIRRLLPYSGKLISQQTKKSKYYIRDSGLTNMLLKITLAAQISKHSGPAMDESSDAARKLGKSWEGFVVENLHGMLEGRWTAYYYRSYQNHEIDLVIDFFDGDFWAIEIRYSSKSRLTRGNYKALEELNPTEAYVVHSDNDEVLLPEGVWSIPLKRMMQKLQEKAEKKFDDV